MALINPICVILLTAVAIHMLFDIAKFFKAATDCLQGKKPLVINHAERNISIRVIESVSADANQ
jgi:hypothetical protein